MRYKNNVVIKETYLIEKRELSSLMRIVEENERHKKQGLDYNNGQHSNDFDVLELKNPEGILHSDNKDVELDNILNTNNSKELFVEIDNFTINRIAVNVNPEQFEDFANKLQVRDVITFENEKGNIEQFEIRMGNKTIELSKADYLTDGFAKFSEKAKIMQTEDPTFKNETLKIVKEAETGELRLSFVLEDGKKINMTPEFLENRLEMIKDNQVLKDDPALPPASQAQEETVSQHEKGNHKGEEVEELDRDEMCSLER